MTFSPRACPFPTKATSQGLTAQSARLFINHHFNKLQRISLGMHSSSAFALSAFCASGRHGAGGGVKRLKVPLAFSRLFVPGEYLAGLRFFSSLSLHCLGAWPIHGHLTFIAVAAQSHALKKGQRGRGTSAFRATAQVQWPGNERSVWANKAILLIQKDRPSTSSRTRTYWCARRDRSPLLAS